MYTEKVLKNFYMDNVLHFSTLMIQSLDASKHLFRTLGRG